MNSFDIMFLDIYQRNNSENIIKNEVKVEEPQASLSCIRYNKKTKEFRFEHPFESQEISVYIQLDFLVATQGELMYKVCYGTASVLEFILELSQTRINQFGVNESDIQKLWGLTEMKSCDLNQSLYIMLRNIIKQLHTSHLIDKLQASMFIYNILIHQGINESQVLTIYHQLLQHIKDYKKQTSYKMKVSLIIHDLSFFLDPTHQHFPKMKKNCSKCKVCLSNNLVHKSKYYCKACFEATGRQWSLCLDGCFATFHMDPLKYTRRKQLKFH